MRQNSAKCQSRGDDRGQQRHARSSASKNDVELEDLPDKVLGVARELFSERRVVPVDRRDQFLVAGDEFE